MATRFCGICGTEVDETAAFCPSCGNPIDPDQQAAQIPPAPAWPEPEPEVPTVEPDAPTDRDGPDATAARGMVESPAEAPERADAPEPGSPPEPRLSARPGPGRPAPAALDAAPPARDAPEPTIGPPPDAGRGPREQVELPFTPPTMLSGWLIGIGALVAALSLLLDFRTFANPVTLIVFLLLLAVAAGVFLASTIPDFPNRRLWVLVVVAGAFGIGLWRVGLGANFAGAVFFLGALAAAIGAVMIELGRDRLMGGPVG